MKLSDDGLYFWDGQRWVTTLSHDGRSRWNGQAWVPVGAVPAPGGIQPSRSARVATSWTKPLQYSVAAWYALQGIFAITLPFLLLGPMTAYFNQIVQQQAELSPNTTPPPADFMSMMTTVVTVSLVIGVVIGVAISVVAIIGALKGWTWVFYVVLVLLALQTISFPFTLISTLVGSGLNPVQVPALMNWASVALGFPAVALFVWMLIAAIKRGPWAMTRAA